MGINLKNDDPKILANFGSGLVKTGEKIIIAARNKTLFTQTTIAKAMKQRNILNKEGFEPID